MRGKLKQLFFILAFIEGGAVMCVELCSAKMLSPYFGTSIYVWAAVLGITLTALMTGYYLGGYISSKNRHPKVLCWLMLAAGCLMILAPAISRVVLPFAITINVLSGTILSLFCFLFFPLVLFGATSPLLINALTENAKESGKSSGNVYAISTLGGIVVTFFTGFYALPELGIKITLYGYGLLVVLATVLVFIATRNFKIQIMLFVGIALLSSSLKNHPNPQIIYESEGIMGNVKVVDRSFNNGRTYRELMVNNISQTMMDKAKPDSSLWNYVDVLTYNIRSYVRGNKTLLLGLGGGTLYKQLRKQNRDVDVVEIDSRIAKLAKKYFFVDNDLKIVIDDARHYVKTTAKQYDLIIYDLYNSETPPIHLMTREAFSEIRELLSETGVLIVNFYGFIAEKKGRAARSVYRTLLDQKFDVRLIPTKGEERVRNLLFICGKSQLEASALVIHEPINASEINFDDAVLLVDDKPVLEHLYLEAALQWRKDYNEVNAKEFLRRK